MAEPGCGPELFLPPYQFPPGYDRSIHGRCKRELTIERDLWEDDDENVVPLKTDLNLLPPHEGKYPPTDFSDRIRYNEWEAEEAKYYSVIRLPRDKLSVVDNYIAADKICDDMVENIDKYEGEHFINVGLDTEKENSTFQTSLLLRDSDGRDRHYERHVLFQMRTKYKSSSEKRNSGRDAAVFQSPSGHLRRKKH